MKIVEGLDVEMLTNNEIKKQMDQGNIIIRNLQDGALKKPNSVDIRIGNTLYVYDYQVVDARNGRSYLEEVMNDKPVNLKRIQIPETGLLLQPGKVYLTKTIEEVETHGYVPVMHGKVSLSLLGVSTELNSGYKYDEYQGSILLSIVATKPTIIYPDIPIGNLSFFQSLGVSHQVGSLNGISYGIYSSGMLSGEEIQKRMMGDHPDIFIDNTDQIVINPNSVNLTLNGTVGVYVDPILDIKEKNTIKYVDIEDGMWFYPDEVYLGRTNEWTETQNLVPMMSGRSSIGRNGIHVHCSAGMGSVGYCGYWHMGIRPTKPIWVVKDLKCCQIYYYTLDGDLSNTYEGYMQNLPKEELGSQLHRILKKER